MSDIMYEELYTSGGETSPLPPAGGLQLGYKRFPFILAYGRWAELTLRRRVLSYEWVPTGWCSGCSSNWTELVDGFQNGTNAFYHETLFRSHHIMTACQSASEVLPMFTQTRFYPHIKTEKLIQWWLTPCEHMFDWRVSDFFYKKFT